MDGWEVLHFNRSSTRIGFPVIIEERFIDGETNFRPQLERIKNTSPDAILIGEMLKNPG